MFQYAFAKSLEVYTGRNVYIDVERAGKKPIGEGSGSNIIREYGLNNFNITLKQVHKVKRSMWNYICGDKWYYEVVKFLIEHDKYPYKYFSQKGFQNISIPIPTFDEIEGNTYIKGWFQTEKYFADIRDILLKEFTPKKEILLPAEIEEIISETESVSVHIRRGDYKKSKMVLDREYYIEALKMLSDKIKAPMLVVFSDDIEYVKEHYSFEESVIYIDDSYKLKDYEQMILMSKCKHNIIANSTFSWWGAWLNTNESKTVIAPVKWFSSQKNIVPTDWIQL